MRRLLATQDDAALLIGRLMLAVVIWPHGAQKVLGIFGGPGPAATYQMFTAQMHLPGWLGCLAMAAEFAGPIGLLLGLFTRAAAFGILCDMGAAMYLVHWRMGFFMNWSGAKPGEGFEYHLLAIGLALVVMIGGAGALSLDRALTRPVSYERHARRHERAREPARV